MVWAAGTSSLSNRVFADYDAVVEASASAWNKLVTQVDRVYLNANLGSSRSRYVKFGIGICEHLPVSSKVCKLISVRFLPVGRGFVQTLVARIAGSDDRSSACRLLKRGMPAPGAEHWMPRKGA